MCLLSCNVFLAINEQSQVCIPDKRKMFLNKHVKPVRLLLCFFLVSLTKPGPLPLQDKTYNHVLYSYVFISNFEMVWLPDRLLWHELKQECPPVGANPPDLMCLCWWWSLTHRTISWTGGKAAPQTRQMRQNKPGFFFLLRVACISNRWSETISRVPCKRNPNQMMVRHFCCFCQIKHPRFWLTIA